FVDPHTDLAYNENLGAFVDDKGNPLVYVAQQAPQSATTASSALAFAGPMRLGGPEEPADADAAEAGLVRVADRPDDAEESDPITTGLARISRHAGNLRSLIDSLNDPTERAMLVQDYMENGTESVLGAVIGDKPFYGPMVRGFSRLFGTSFPSDEQIVGIVSMLTEAAERTDALVGQFSQAAGEGSLTTVQRAFVTGDMTGLSEREKYQVFDYALQTRMLSPNSFADAYRQETVAGQVMSLAESVNCPQSLLAVTSAGLAGVLDVFSAAKRIAPYIEQLKNLGAGVDNPFLIPGFKGAVGEAMELAIRLERSALRLGENVLLSAL